ncbi:hypothetical protein SCHPADRAFT_981263 [Schizopora paradoxa]|uniref:Uncharacterized protein n=1 Tax=Schizopora paradoxa TaxID=27342 RepID=A0A0H2RVJ3_9AGAM|nr:hypothetical protein SCHPADRAFT_981263 [Schizopora paradoxa]
MSYEYCSPLAKTSSQSSISTNATAPDLPGPGRLVGLLLDRVGKHLETLLNKCANQFALGPAHVAQEIRILSRHDEFTIPERYLAYSMHFSEKEMRVLRRRCRRLLKFAGSRLLSTQLVALNEISMLAIENSLIRTIFAECRLEHLEPKYLEPDLLLMSAKALSSIEEAATHALWSSIVLHPDYDIADLQVQSIKESLADPNTSFIANRHLVNAVQCTSLPISYALVGSFVEVATSRETWSSIEWSSLSNCLCEFARLEPTRFMFASFLYDVLTEPDRGKLFVRRNTSDSGMTFERVTDWSLDDCASFCVAFLTTLSGSADIFEQLSFIKDVDAGTRRLLEGTVLLDEMCIAYCHLKHFSGANYSERSPIIKMSNPHILPRAMAILARGLDDEIYRLETLLFESILQIECQILLVFVWLGGTCGSDTQDGYVASFVWSWREYFSFSQPPVRVYAFDLGRVFETFRKKRSAIEEIFQRHSDQNVSVDVLTCDYDDLMEIQVGEADTFDATGHYPILAGYDETGRAGRAHFCARIGSDPENWTCVPEGSSIASFTDAKGEIQDSPKFRVLVLRFDPSDTLEDSARNVEGIKNPTGPLHWRSIWPCEDPSLSYVMDESGYDWIKTKFIPFFERCAHVGEDEGFSEVIGSIERMNEYNIPESASSGGVLNDYSVPFDSEDSLDSESIERRAGASESREDGEGIEYWKAKSRRLEEEIAELKVKYPEAR